MTQFHAKTFLWFLKKAVWCRPQAFLISFVYCDVLSFTQIAHHKYLITQTSPAIISYAVVWSFLDAAVDVGKENKSFVALKLNETMIGALIEFVAVFFVRRVNFGVFFTSFVDDSVTVDDRPLWRSNCDEKSKNDWKEYGTVSGSLNLQIVICYRLKFSFCLDY